MRFVAIPKRRGSYRYVCVPSDTEKKALKALLPELNKLQTAFCGPAVHGFMPLRSAVTNAKAHVGKKITVCFDLKDFFDTVTRDKVTNISNTFADTKYDICFIDGVTRQGLPTSPALANIAAACLDAVCLVQLRRIDPTIVYTRYADDITVSFDDETLIDLVKERIRMYVNDCGFILAEHKTTVYKEAGGYRKITGVSVGPDGIRPTRESKRKLRAALHQNNESSARGLEEWQKLKTPPDATTPLSRICLHYGLPVVTPAPKTVSTHVVVSPNVRVYTLPEHVLSAAHICYSRPTRLLMTNSGEGLLNWALDPRVCLLGKEGWSHRVDVGNVTLSDVTKLTTSCLAIETEHGLVAFKPFSNNRASRTFTNTLRRLNVKIALNDNDLRSRTDFRGLKEITVEMRRTTKRFHRPSGVIVKAERDKITLRFYVEEVQQNDY